MLLRSVALGRHSCKVGKSPILRLGDPRRPSIAIRLERRHVNGSVGPSPGQIGPQESDTEEPSKIEYNKPTSKWGPTLFKMLECAATTFASLFVLGLVDTDFKTQFEDFTDYRRLG